MTPPRDLRGELDRDDGELPTSWIPKVGDVLVGELIRYDRGSTPYGPQVIAVLADEQTGELRGAWLLHEVLRQEFKDQRPRPGERLGIKRLPDSEKGYKRYRLRIDRDQPEVPDFDGGAPAADAAPAPPQHQAEVQRPSNANGANRARAPEPEGDWRLAGDDDEPPTPEEAPSWAR